MKKYLPIALMLGFFFVGFTIFITAKPTPKAPIYKTISKYSPYYLEKRFGGLEILNKEDKKFKEKPVNADLFKRYEFLQKKWGRGHLKIENNTLLINAKSGAIKIPIKSKKDRAFLKSFYGL